MRIDFIALYIAMHNVYKIYFDGFPCTWDFNDPYQKWTPCIQLKNNKMLHHDEWQIKSPLPSSSLIEKHPLLIALKRSFICINWAAQSFEFQNMYLKSKSERTEIEKYENVIESCWKGFPSRFNRLLKFHLFKWNNFVRSYGPACKCKCCEFSAQDENNIDTDLNGKNRNLLLLVIC